MKREIDYRCVIIKKFGPHFNPVFFLSWIKFDDYFLTIPGYQFITIMCTCHEKLNCLFVHLLFVVIASLVCWEQNISIWFTMKNRWWKTKFYWRVPLHAYTFSKKYSQGWGIVFVLCSDLTLIKSWLNFFLELEIGLTTEKIFHPSSWHTSRPDAD